MGGTKHQPDNEDEVIKSVYSLLYIQPETELVINVAMGLNHPIDVESLKLHLSKSLLVRHPLFSSLLVKPQGKENVVRGNNNNNNNERWRRTQVRIEDHVIFNSLEFEPSRPDEVAYVDSYLAKLAGVNSPPLSRDKPLWEVHVVTAGPINFLVLRVHHVIGDGISVMSMLEACFGRRRGRGGCREGDIDQVVAKWKKKNNKYKEEGGMWELVKGLGLTVRFVGQALGRSLWVRDDHGMTGLYSHRGKMAMCPKAMVSLVFNLDDIKSLKRVVPNATANDVVLGVISSGLSKYLKVHSPQGLPDGHQVTGLVLVNMRDTAGLIKEENLIESSSSSSSRNSNGEWGNKIAILIVPLNYYDDKTCNPIEHVRRVKHVMDQKKQSFEAQFVDKFNALVTYLFGPKFLSESSLAVQRNTTFLLSNISGPREEISIAENPVTYIKLTTSSLPAAIAVHMVSYMGKVNLQITVSRDIVKDPPFLA